MTALVEAVKRQVNAIDLSKTMGYDEIAEAVLWFPCGFCGAQPLQSCRSTRNKTRKARTHSSREATLWAMWHKGYRAGRERALNGDPSEYPSI